MGTALTTARHAMPSKPGTPWFDRLHAPVRVIDPDAPIPEAVQFTMFGPTARGPSLGPTHGGVHFVGEKKYNAIQNDLMWRTRCSSEAKIYEKAEANNTEDIPLHTVDQQQWNHKKRAFLRDAVVRDTLRRAKMRADQIDRGDRAGAPWFPIGASGAANAQRIAKTPDENTWAARTFPPAQPSRRGGALTPLPKKPHITMKEHTKRGWQPPVPPHARSQSVLERKPPAQHTLPPPRSETPWLTRNTRPKRKWDTPIPGHPGAHSMEIKSGWVTMNNTGRGYLVSPASMQRTGVLDRASGARSICAYMGNKD